MAFTKYTENEYESQHFGFSSISVVTGLLDSMERKLLSVYNFDADALAKSKEALSAVYRESIDRHTDDLKAIVNLYIAIPKNVLLPDDDCQREQFSEEQERNFNLQLQATRNQFQALCLFEKRLQETVLSITNYKELVDEMAKLQKHCESLISLQETRKPNLNHKGIIKSLASLIVLFKNKLSLD